MTTTYDPKHPSYLDEADVRDEMTRVYDLCHGCRLCFKFCTSFPTLFEYHRPPRRPGRRPADAGAAGPGRRRVLPVQALLRQLPVHPRAARVGDRLPPADAARRRDAPRHRPGRACATGPPTAVMGRTDLLGKVGHGDGAAGQQGRRRQAGLAGAQGRREDHRRVERAAAAAVRPAAVHDLVQASGPSCASTSARVVSPCSRRAWSSTRSPTIGHDLVKVYERNGIECSLTDGAGCCGAPWLHSGDVDQFTKVADEERRRRWPSRCARATTSSCPSRRAATS